MLTLGDLLHYSVGTLLADIVYDNVRTKTGVHESVCPAKTLTGTGDNNSLAIESNLR